MRTRDGEALVCLDGQIGFRYVRQDREEKNRGLELAQAVKFAQNAAKFHWWKVLLLLPANVRIWQKAPSATATVLPLPRSGDLLASRAASGRVRSAIELWPDQAT